MSDFIPCSDLSNFISSCVPLSSINKVSLEEEIDIKKPTYIRSEFCGFYYYSKLETVEEEKYISVSFYFLCFLIFIYYW
jgi:hypothetical protein